MEMWNCASNRVVSKELNDFNCNNVEHECKYVKKNKWEGHAGEGFACVKQATWRPKKNINGVKILICDT